MTHFLDDLGHVVALPRAPRRVVCLVPSLTEAVAWSAPETLVAATDWCSHVGSAQVTRIGGTKNPRVGEIVSLGPDLVIAEDEENRPEDLAALRAAGLPVWTTQVRSVADALRSIGRLVDALDVGRVTWLEDARRAWAAPPAVRSGQRLRAVVPIWRRPWMAVGSQTYAGDVLRRLGVDNVLGTHTSRYPTVVLPDLPPVDLVVLPDEPYRFTAQDGPDAFPRARCALVDGRALTWYGPAMIAAPERLVRQLRRPLDPREAGVATSGQPRR
ncbi:helical backbone metal receptor [Arsenicicoccus dermatophilus]|uniref:helical backbone metal receptor n=1 Tax=Arsenicicoccus dermatophilus TaxID=1076331 RepID=UPI001F4C62F5|nr:helical backbone metal receptor [Arsenicicoccus dermatophilus]